MIEAAATAGVVCLRAGEAQAAPAGPLRALARKALAAFAMGGLFEYLFYGRALGVSVAVFVWTSLLTAGLAGARAGRRLSPSQALAGAGALAFSALFVLRDAPELRTADLAASAYLFLLFFVPWFRNRPLETLETGDYALAPARLVAGSLAQGKDDLEALWLGARTGAVPAQRVLSGVLTAAPVLAALLALMMSADMVFDKLLGAWVSRALALLPSACGRSVVAAGVALAFMGLYACLTPDEHAAGGAGWTELARGAGEARWGFIESNVAGGLVNSLFLAFTAVQGLFLLGGRERVEALGITYSEYARQGFWQMVYIGVLTLILAVLFEEKVARETRAQRFAHKGNLLLTCMMMGVLMVSAAYRLWLYEQCYGFTVLRFYSHTFTLYVAAVFVLFALKAVMDQSREAFLARAAAAGGALLAGWSLADPHAVIAKKNIAMHLSGERALDVGYVLSLSADAVPALARALPSLDGAARAPIERELGRRRRALASERAADGWPAFHLARSRAIAAAEGIEP